MENLTEGPHRSTIVSERAIYSAAGDGRIPFISAEDIAQAAAVVLTADAPPNDDFVLTGADARSYGQVAESISAAIGETVTHVPLDVDALVARHVANGLDEPHAATLAFMDLAIAEGAEDRVTPDLEQLLAQPPLAFSDFVAEHAPIWRA